MSDPATANLHTAAVTRNGEAVGAASPPVRVLLLGPMRSAVSGVSTHLNQLFASSLATSFELLQFQVGSEGRADGRMRTLMRLAGSPFTFAARLLRVRPTIVHINTSLEPKSYWRDLVYLLIAKLLRRKVVYQVHGGALPADFFAGKPARTALLRAVLGWPDVVVLLAQCEMSAYAAFAPRARLLLIANAIFSPQLELRSERYLAQRPLRALYVGRLVAVKGVFEALGAVRLLRERGVAVELKIAGSGPALEDLRREITAQKLEGCVELVGPVFGAAKDQLWQEADVFAFPTYHREGLPYALLEAMALGAVPVISPVGAIPDVIEDQVQGVLVPDRDPPALAKALERLATDRAALYRMARAGRARVLQQYSVSRLANEFAVLYARLGS
jgi:glycosyltransferase involved in cell wall biosynthesis